MFDLSSIAIPLSLCYNRGNNTAIWPLSLSGLFFLPDTPPGLPRLPAFLPPATHETHGLCRKNSLPTSRSLPSSNGLLCLSSNSAPHPSHFQGLVTAEYQSLPQLGHCLRIISALPPSPPSASPAGRSNCLRFLRSSYETCAPLV